LDQELKASFKEDEAVIIAMHIWINGWNSADKQSFEKIIKVRKANVIGIFTGHSHVDDTIEETIGTSIPRINVVGLSTSHANAPGFREMAMVKKDGSWAFKDSRTMTMLPTRYPGVKPSVPVKDKNGNPVPQTPPPPPLDFKVHHFYSFNEEFCPKKNQSGKLTMLECIKKPDTKGFDKHRQAGNPNCMKYSGGKCYSAQELSGKAEELPPEES
jgi:hypothetical protein